MRSIFTKENLVKATGLGVIALVALGTPGILFTNGQTSASNSIIKVAPPCNFAYVANNNISSTTIEEVNDNRDHWNNNFGDYNHSVDFNANGIPGIGANGLIHHTCGSDTRAYAAISGEIIEARNRTSINSSDNGGNTLVIQSDDGHIKVTYLHLAGFDVSLGDTVVAGQKVATIGKTGNQPMSVHLHFEVRKDNVKQHYDNWRFASVYEVLGGQSSQQIRPIYLGTDNKADFVKIWEDNGDLYADAHLSSGSSFTKERWADAQGGLSSTYDFEFYHGDFNGDGRDDIAKVWEQGGLNIDVHLTNEFENGFTKERWATNQGGLSSTYNFQWFVGDFNGDGRDDLAKLWKEDGLLNSDVHLSVLKDPNIADEFKFTKERWATGQGGLNSNFDFQWFVGDFNGDGRDDIVKIWEDDGDFYSDAHISVLKDPNIADKFEFAKERWADADGGMWHDMQWFVGDFNADGRSDLVKIWESNDKFYSDAHLSVLKDPNIADEYEFKRERWASADGGMWNEMQWFVGDFDGTGTTDLVKIWESGGNFYSDAHLSLDNSSATASGYKFNRQRWASADGGFGSNFDFHWMVANFDGDSNGKDDLVKVWEDDGKLNADAHISTGTSFSRSRWATDQGGFCIDMLLMPSNQISVPKNSSNCT